MLNSFKDAFLTLAAIVIVAGVILIAVYMVVEYAL